MSPEQIEVERKAFEEVMRRDTFDSLERVSNGDYLTYEARVGWIAWLARAEKAQRVREALERILKSFPTDTDMHAARWEQIEVDEACNAYDAARAALKG